MLKATKVEAISLQLTDSGHAVLVQDGPDWNGLRKFNCIAPPKCDGQMVIAAKDHESNPMAAAFGAIFDLGGKERWVVVMTSPALGALLQR